MTTLLTTSPSGSGNHMRFKSSGSLPSAAACSIKARSLGRGVGSLMISSQRSSSICASSRSSRVRFSLARAEFRQLFNDVGCAHGKIIPLVGAKPKRKPFSMERMAAEAPYLASRAPTRWGPVYLSSTARANPLADTAAKCLKAVY
jgi:hypothetical protein